MYPYYIKDIENGVLTKEEAFELVEDFFLSLNKDSDLYPGVQTGDNGQSMVLGGIDESGKEIVNELSVVEKMDYMIMDIKIADRFGVFNDTILENFQFLKYSGKPFLIRTPIIEGYTDSKENLEAIATLVDGCDWEKIPENTMAGAKWEMII